LERFWTFYYRSSKVPDLVSLIFFLFENNLLSKNVFFNGFWKFRIFKQTLFYFSENLKISSILNCLTKKYIFYRYLNYHRHVRKQFEMVLHEM
jgi:hypothetical protein